MTDGRPENLRISDADRHRVAEVLRDAAAEGRIDLTELDERITATYAAKTYGDLIPITADLPGPGGLIPLTPSSPVPTASATPGAEPAIPAARHDASFAMFGGCDRRGIWEIGAQHTAVAIMGGVNLDLREARFTARETVINATAIWGGVDLTVNAETVVIVDGVGVMGGFAQSRDRVEPQLTADSPVVRVKGLALMGGVNVTRKPLPGEERSLRRQ